jgi:hypothetical protein
MLTSLSILLEAYGKTWNMCLALSLFFAGVAVLAYFMKAKDMDFQIPSWIVFWACLASAFVVFSVCLTLIDKPHFAASEVTLNWLFMFSAFLGIPVALPMLAGMVWALAHHIHREPLNASSLALLMLGTFAIGCAVSNVHDVIWCGAITDGYTHHFQAGYDLDYFVGFGRKFGISREVLADYATLGPCAIVLVLGELVVAASCFVRLGNSEGNAGAW